MTASRFFIFFLLLLSFTALHAAQVDDIRIVIDVSGSMLKTDPHNLRAPALRMLNGLLPGGSKAGVWTFAKFVNMEVKWGTVNDEWRKQADLGAARIHSRGQFTNIEAALKVASSGWGSSIPGSRRNLIFLTDGKVDISKDQASNDASRKAVIEQSIPDLVNKGVKVHVVALSLQTDEVLLKRLALNTHGSFEVAHSAHDLQRIFLRMFERATRPDTVRLQGNRFTIDDSINEMTLLVFRKAGEETKVVQPDGVIHSQSDHSDAVKWRFEKGYDLITVRKPKSGEWTLQAEEDDDNRVMIVTDLKLVVDDLPAYVTPDESLKIQLELQNQGKKIDKNSFLKFVDFKLEQRIGETIQTSPVEAVDSRELKDKGRFVHQISGPLKEGEHEIIVSADARTFSRTQRFSVEVEWPVKVEIEKSDKAGIYHLKVSAREEYIKPESLMLKVHLQQPSGGITQLELASQGVYQTALVAANQSDGLYQLLISLQAETVEGKRIQHELSAYTVLGTKPLIPDKSMPPEEGARQGDSEAGEAIPAPAAILSVAGQNDEPVTQTNTLVIVMLVNTFMLLIAAGLYFYIRRKRKSDTIQLVDEDLIVSSTEFEAGKEE